MVFVSYLGLSFWWVQGGLGIDFDDCALVKLGRSVHFSGCDMGLFLLGRAWAIRVRKSGLLSRLYVRLRVQNQDLL